MQTHADLMEDRQYSPAWRDMGLDDDAPSRAEAREDALLTEQARIAQEKRDAAARARGEWVPTNGQRSTAAEISLDLSRHGMHTAHKVIPRKPGVFKVETDRPVPEDHPALAGIRGEYQIVDGVLWIKDEHLPPEDPPF